jgi:hypothetical protein
VITILRLFLAICAVTPLLLPAQSAGPDKWEQEQKTVDVHIAVFDDLDFNVFSGRDWKNLQKSHTDDVLVHWPGGHTTKGVQKHIQDLDYMFTYAPDTRIKQHAVKIGQGEWTAVYGIMEGTFTKMMETADGKTIPPTGESFKLPMATIGHWTKQGKMDEEYLSWDNHK